MKKFFACLLIFSSFFGCNNDDKAAADRLVKAKSLNERGEYNAAKLQIDSIRLLYPKSYDVVKEAVLLNREVERREQSRNSIYCDSILRVLREKEVLLKKDFVLEKNTQYQAVGNWILPSQQVEKNTRRSYLRCGVDEEGNMNLTSVYYGAQPIHYTAMKVSVDDNTFAQTLPVPENGGTNFSFVDLGMTTQIISYTHKNENGVAGFVRLYAYKPMKVQYLGGKSYSYILDQKTKLAILQTHALYQVMSSIRRFEQEKKVADAKLIYLAKKELDNK